MLYTLSSIISTHHFYVFGTTPTGNGLQRIEPIACAQESGNWRILAPEKTWVGNADDWKIEAALGYSISEGLILTMMPCAGASYIPELRFSIYFLVTLERKSIL